MIVTDTFQDDRFADNPSVHDDPRISFTQAIRSSSTTDPVSVRCASPTRVRVPSQRVTSIDCGIWRVSPWMNSA